MQRLADLGTRLRALNDADSPTIEAELAAIRDLDLSRETWEEYTEAAEEARLHFLTRGQELLKGAQAREVAA